MTIHRSRCGALLALILLFTGFADSAGAQTLDPRLRSAFDDPPVRMALMKEIAEAERLGLPQEPLVQKALEGRSKGAADSLILTAVRALRGRLEVVADRLGPEAEPSTLVAGAAALQLGVGLDALEDIARATQVASLAMALVVLGDLVGRGVDPLSARDALTALGSAQVDVATLVDFRRHVEIEIQSGTSPDPATARWARVLVSRAGGVRPGRRP